MQAAAIRSSVSTSFKLKSPLSLSLCLISFLFAFTLIGCGSSGSGDQKKESGYVVKFYDANLDLNYTLSLTAAGSIDLSALTTEYDLPPALYAASSAVDLASNPSYPVTRSINFYGVPNVKEITNETELSAIRSNLSGKYILLNDITLTSTTLDDTEGWSPIGDSSTPFTGILNGNGYKVSGLWIDRSSIDNVGLFGYINNGAKISNFGVSINNVKGGVKGRKTVGAIAGYTYNSSIKNSYSMGNVSGDNSVGGIAGFLTSSIENSYAMGDVSGVGYVGGIVGQVSGGAISKSYAAGNVIGSDNYVGGIVGQADSASSINNSYSTGDVSGVANVGGIAGYVHNSTITNNAAINSAIVSASADAGRVVGYNNSATISNNFALATMKVNGATYDVPTTNDHNGTSKTIGDLTTQATYDGAISGDGLGGLGWQFGDDDDNPWKIDASKNNGYPYLYWQD
ncbi:MAG: hypothetical protein LBI57_06505 [Helicobacteraceae bacterium]|jgi:hypothetical protein|nr:hypothetical protein [Helicobacteraceae bacterium]